MAEIDDSRMSVADGVRKASLEKKAIASIAPFRREDSGYRWKASYGSAACTRSRKLGTLSPSQRARGCGIASTERSTEACAEWFSGAGLATKREVEETRSMASS